MVNNPSLEPLMNAPLPLSPNTKVDELIIKLVPSHDNLYPLPLPALKCPLLFNKTPVPLVKVCDAALAPYTSVELFIRNVVLPLKWKSSVTKLSVLVPLNEILEPVELPAKNLP